MEEKREENQEESRQGSKESGEEKRLPGQDAYEWVQALVCSVLTVVMIFTFAVRLIGVDGHSMVPTLQHADRLVVLSPILYHDYKAGDIVVLRKESFSTEPIVKRVIAVEGQTVDIDFSAGSVTVDGVELDEPYINELTFTDEGTEFPLTLGEGEIFVMGDNRNHSTDSRDTRIGPVDTRYVVGRAVALALPGPDSLTGERDFSRIGVLH
ncbi:MAG: signal peptidase I [Dysosmobacter sp.]|nr:signal peptidase I [Dysosmobacter sp.]